MSEANRERTNASILELIRTNSTGRANKPVSIIGTGSYSHVKIPSASVSTDRVPATFLPLDGLHLAQPEHQRQNLPAEILCLYDEFLEGLLQAHDQEKNGGTKHHQQSGEDQASRESVTLPSFKHTAGLDKVQKQNENGHRNDGTDDGSLLIVRTRSAALPAVLQAKNQTPPRPSDRSKPLQSSVLGEYKDGLRDIPMSASSPISASTPIHPRKKNPPTPVRTRIETSNIVQSGDSRSVRASSEDQEEVMMDILSDQGRYNVPMQRGRAPQPVLQGKNLRRCFNCDESFPDFTYFIAHVFQQHHSELDKIYYECCKDHVFKVHSPMLKNHLRRDHFYGPIPFPCHECPDSFPNFLALELHMKRYHTVKPHFTATVKEKVQQGIVEYWPNAIVWKPSGALSPTEPVQRRVGASSFSTIGSNLSLSVPSKMSQELVQQKSQSPYHSATTTKSPALGSREPFKARFEEPMFDSAAPKPPLPIEPDNQRVEQLTPTLAAPEPAFPEESARQKRQSPILTTTVSNPPSSPPLQKAPPQKNEHHSHPASPFTGARLECLDCSVVMSKIPEMTKHIHEHHSKFHARYSFRCCGVLFDRQGSFLTHQVHVHDHSGRWPCPLCFESFLDMGSFYGHLKLHRSEPVRTASDSVKGDDVACCSACSNVFAPPAEKDRHLCSARRSQASSGLVDASRRTSLNTTSGDGAAFKCWQCGQDFATPWDRERHICSINLNDNSRKNSLADVVMGGTEEASVVQSLCTPIAHGQQNGDAATPAIAPAASGHTNGGDLSNSRTSDTPSQSQCQSPGASGIKFRTSTAAALQEATSAAKSRGLPPSRASEGWGNRVSLDPRLQRR